MRSEVDLINSYINDGREGITDLGDALLMPVRITGLGFSYRLNHEETVKALRDATQVQSDDLQELINAAHTSGLQFRNFLKYDRLERARGTFSHNLEIYNGMPLTIGHPYNDGEKDLLNAETIKQNPIIGTIVKAYPKGDSVWGIAKIYDRSVLEVLETYKSTSPAVISIEQDGVEMPLQINHLAFVENGFWDDFVGTHAIDNKTIKEVKMADSQEVIYLPEHNQITDDAELVKEAKAEVAQEEAEAKAAEEVAQVKKDEAKVAQEEAKAKEAEAKAAQAVAKAAQVKAEVAQKSQEVEIEADKIPEVKADEVEEIAEPVVELQDDETDDSDEVEVESEDDKERDETMESIRKASDSAPNLGVKIPYFRNRVSGAFAKQAFMRKNAAFVDSKYMGLVFSNDATRGVNAMLNRALIDEAFQDTLRTIKKEGIKDTLRASKGLGWRVTSNPRVQVDPNF